MIDVVHDFDQDIHNFLLNYVLSFLASDPGVSQSLVWSQSGAGVPVQTPSDEVHHGHVLLPPQALAEDHGQVPGCGVAALSDGWIRASWRKTVARVASGD